MKIGQHDINGLERVRRNNKQGSAALGRNNRAVFGNNGFQSSDYRAPYGENPALTADRIIDKPCRVGGNVVPLRLHIDEIILGGGGSYNLTLRRMLQAELPGIPIFLHEDFGILGDAKETMALAILGNETMLSVVSDVRSAAGTARPMVLGKIVLPPNPTNE